MVDVRDNSSDTTHGSGRSRALTEPSRPNTQQMPTPPNPQDNSVTAEKPSADVRNDSLDRPSSSPYESGSGFHLIDGDVNGPGYNETTVDIIAVPCPGASPVDTWARDPLSDDYFNVSNAEQYPTARQLPGSSILSPAISRHLPRAKDLWILQGVRTEISTARVLLYRHGELNEGTTIDQLADDLLQHLCHLRQEHSKARPFFFVCHSIGGLVVKQALVKASLNEKLRWIVFDCHGTTFFATPHRGSSYLSMPNLRDSIEHLLYLSRPLPRSISDGLRLNHRPLLRLHERFMDIASEMNIWTFYETIDSQLSGLGMSEFDEVHFSAPLASIKSSLVGSRHEQALSLESEHAKCASFGPKNTRIMESYLEDLHQAVNKAQKLSADYIHTPLHLPEHVKLELIGFYDDPNPDTVSDVRLYVSKHKLNEFLEKGPERCLSERLNTKATKPRRASIRPASRTRPTSAGGLSHLGAGALGIWSNVQDFGSRILHSARSQSDTTVDSPEQAEGPQIVVTSHTQRPTLGDTRSAASAPAIVPSRRSRGLTVPALATPDFRTPSSRESSPGRGTDSDKTSRTLSEPLGSDVSPRTAGETAPLAQQLTGDAPLNLDEKEYASTSGDRKHRSSRASALEDLTAGFSRPDPSKRKFMWIHLPYTNPQWVKTIFDKLSETQHRNYSNLLRNQYWTGRHVQGRHGQIHASYVRPGCAFVPAEASKSCSPRPTSPDLSGRNSPALNSPDHFYLYLPYLHFDTYRNLIRRRNIVRRRLEHGRARPVPKDVADMSLDIRVIWEYLGHDPPLNTRRTLDQYGYPSLRDTYARDDDQMMYKLTKERISGPTGRKNTDMFGTRAMKEQTPISPASRFASIVNTVKAELVMHDKNESPGDAEDDILDGNILMVDQLWLWSVDMTTITTFFPKRESHPTEGPMFQQADLRNSIYNELNGDLSGRCDNALDLAAFITLHAVTVLLDRTSHPDLEIFRIFEEAIGILTERMTSSLKRFRMQTFRERIHESESDSEDYDDNRSESIKQRHKRELEQAERENRENTSALLELRDMDDELKTLSNLFREQTTVIEKMRSLYEDRDELREHTHNGRRYLDEALSRLADYEQQVEDMTVRIAATRSDYEKLLEMAQRKAQVDEVRWSRLQTELASTQNLSVIIFTTFTVIFLPLSFFTSLFGMNTADWAGEDGTAYMTLSTIGAISLPGSFALIAVALIAAFSSRVQGFFKSTFEGMKGGWEGIKESMAKMQSDSRKEAKLTRRRLRQEREKLSRAKKERSYDFWEAVRMQRQSTYRIPDLNRREPARYALAKRKTLRKSIWKDLTT
ncbi:hypothetical protein PFICI_04116 [Pestalotiopsis fici W106-1]|uniref:DUF676 domain-containing protein n=1 Tax=Pestalotiopsis fici (strain W106-1 / CGMCC3.15140) TaxID=1229662 RepID=W3XLF0_PESFW|nr:uncharacterized protein PFICI_04116 [Pestalotiopsis fici W106-1]ETS86091.1 hypothetical protein PFICI_04116 [Pestalotiopsis fici W106-1]